MKSFRTLSEKGSAGSLKLHSTCPEEHFDEKVFFPSFLQTLREKFSDCENCNLRVFFRNLRSCAAGIGRFRRKKIQLITERFSIRIMFNCDGKY